VYQHKQLVDELNAWFGEIPSFVPDTQIRLSVEQYATQRQARRELTGRLLDCWRRQATHDSSYEAPASFEFSQPIWGELPRLNVDFPQVRSILLEGHRATRGVNGFLQGFSGLNRLAIRNLNLGQLPDAIARLPQLNELTLSDCAVILTEQSQGTLSALQHLSVLDLYKNPLGLCPTLENMADLNYIDLSSTGVTELPPGLLTRPRLQSALLNDNRIEELPDALFNLPTNLQEGFDLGGNPVSAAGRERIKIHFNQTRRDFGIFARQADIQRLQVLYPRLDQEEASEFIYRLPGTLAEGRIELTRLETEYDTLRNELASWTADIPALHPVSGEAFTPQQLTIEHATRDEFKQRVERCWRRETELDDFNQELEPSYELTLTTIITGDLPALHADFSHVSLLYMHSDAGLTSGAGRFLQSFPRLKSLTIRDYALHEIPEAVFRMGRLTTLALSECNITLSAQSVLELAQLQRLDYLDLSHNPLELTPDVSQMPDISTLLLPRTGITELPPGLLKLTGLDVADLSDNAISHIPRDILELPLEIAESINLRGNPLDAQSVQTLIAYFKKTSTDFGVEAVIEQAEMEVSTSEDSEPDE
jgi:Leucine-rich repeat (LRR) protein